MIQSFKIEGMHCASCVSRVEKALKKNPQVSSCQVNLSSEIATVDWQGPADELGQLIQTISDLGYEARHLVSSSPELNPGVGPTPSFTEVLKLGLGLVFTTALMLPMVGVPIGLPLELALTVLVFFGLGTPYFIRGARDLLHLNPSMDSLVFLGAHGALGLSIYQNLIAQTAPTHSYFETAAFMVLMVHLGRFLESKAKQKTRQSLAELALLTEDLALKWTPEGTETVRAKDLRLGDLILVEAGAQVPCDGRIIEGQSSFSEALITGESLPRVRGPGAQVPGGSTNLESPVKLEITATFETGLIAQILALIRDAEARKTPTQLYADRISGFFIPGIMALAALCWLYLAFVMGLPWTLASERALSLLVVACPCALGLATPTAIVVGLGLAARKGLLIRDPSLFELAPKLTQVIFDKTGTLTTAQLKISKSQALGPERPLGPWALLAEQSLHPHARVLYPELLKPGKTEVQLDRLKLEPGRGLSGYESSTQTEYLLGSWDFVEQKQAESGAQSLPKPLLIELWEREGLSISILALRTKGQAPELIYAYGLSDSLRPEAFEVIRSLKSKGLKLAIASGDHSAAVESWANTLGINDWRGALRPGDKERWVRDLQIKGECVLLCGDGGNDSPALKTADWGLSLSEGHDLAKLSAGIILLRPDLRLIPQAIDLAKEVCKTIKQNTFWAFFYNLLALPLAASGHLGPMAASAAMALSSLFVVCNALWLKKRLPTQATLNLETLR